MQSKGPIRAWELEVKTTSMNALHGNDECSWLWSCEKRNCYLYPFFGKAGAGEGK
jgi:hypothetical protein